MLNAKNFILIIKQYQNSKEALFERLKAVPGLTSTRIALFQNQESGETDTHAIVCLGTPMRSSDVLHHLRMTEETIIDSLDTTTELVDRRNILRSFDESFADFVLNRPAQSDTEDSSVQQPVQNEESKEETNTTNAAGSQLNAESSQNAQLSSQLLSMNQAGTRSIDIDHLSSASVVAQRHSQRVKEREEQLQRKIEEEKARAAQRAEKAETEIDYVSEKGANKKSGKRQATSPLDYDKKKKVKIREMTQLNVDLTMKHPADIVFNGKWSLCNIEKLYDAKCSGITLVTQHLRNTGVNILEGLADKKELRQFMKEVINPNLKRFENLGELNTDPEGKGKGKGSKKGKKKKEDMGLYPGMMIPLKTALFAGQKGKRNKKKEQEDEEDIDEDEGPGDLCDDSEIHSGDGEDEYEDDEEEIESEVSKVSKNSQRKTINKKKQDKKAIRESPNKKNTKMDKKQKAKVKDEFKSPKPKNTFKATLTESLNLLSKRQARQQSIKKVEEYQRAGEEEDDEEEEDDQTLNDISGKPKKSSRNKNKGTRKRTTLTDPGDSERKMEIESVKSLNYRSLPGGSELGDFDNDDVASQINSKIDELSQKSSRRGRKQKIKKLKTIKDSSKDLLKELRDDKLWGGAKLTKNQAEQEEGEFGEEAEDDQSDNLLNVDDNGSEDEDEVESGEEQLSRAEQKSIKKLALKNKKIQEVDAAAEQDNENGEEDDDDDGNEDDEEEEEEELYTVDEDGKQITKPSRFVKYGDMSVEELMAQQRRTDSTDINPTGGKVSDDNTPTNVEPMTVEAQENQEILQ